MFAPSNRSLEAAEARFDKLLHPKHEGLLHKHLGVRPDTGHVKPREALEYGEQLFTFADALIANPPLLAFLTDSASTPQMKRQMLDRLLRGKMDLPLVVELEELMNSRWRTSADLVSAVESLGVHCVISSINHDHHTRRVEGELFQLATAMKAEPEASNYLSNPNEPVAARRRLVQTLLAKKADPATLLLAERATINPTAGRFRATLNALVAKIAASRALAVAKVTSPTELTDHQLDRLQKLLSKKYGQPVEVNVSVDPNVIGGLRVEVGDRVLDDTYRARLYDAEQRFAEGSRAAAESEEMELTNV